MPQIFFAKRTEKSCGIFLFLTYPTYRKNCLSIILNGLKPSMWNCLKREIQKRRKRKRIYGSHEKVLCQKSRSKEKRRIGSDLDVSVQYRSHVYSLSSLFHRERIGSRSNFRP